MLIRSKIRARIRPRILHESLNRVAFHARLFFKHSHKEPLREVSKNGRFRDSKLPTLTHVLPVRVRHTSRKNQAFLVQTNAKERAASVATPNRALFLLPQSLLHLVPEMHKSSLSKSEPSTPHGALAGGLALVLQELFLNFYVVRGLFPGKYVWCDPLDQPLQTLLIFLKQVDRLLPGTFLPILPPKRL